MTAASSQVPNSFALRPRRGVSSRSALLIAGSIFLSAGSAPLSAPAGSGPSLAETDERLTQRTIAESKFADAQTAVMDAHRLMPEAVKCSVQFEELKRKRRPDCEEALSEAKTASSRARKAFNEARGRASTAFSFVRRAVNRLNQLGPAPDGSLPTTSLPWVSDLPAIEASLKRLKSLHDRVDSSLTTEQRVRLWDETVEYASGMPESWAKIEAARLVPFSISIPCMRHEVKMRPDSEK